MVFYSKRLLRNLKDFVNITILNLTHKLKTQKSASLRFTGLFETANETKLILTLEVVGRIEEGERRLAEETSGSHPLETRERALRMTSFLQGVIGDMR